MPSTSRLRSTVLQALDETSFDHRREGWEVLDGVWCAFVDLDDLLRAAQQRWFASLLIGVEQAIEAGGADLLADVRGAYRQGVRRHPGLRRLLDDHADHPAIAASVRREHAILAGAAGVTHSDEVTGAARQAA